MKRKSVLHKQDLLLKLSSDLIKAKKYACKKLSLISKEAPQNKWLTERELINYWKIISYDFNDKHLEGLRLFEKYIKKR